MARMFSQYLEEMTSCGGGGTCSGSVATFSRPINGGFVFHRNYPDTIATGSTDNSDINDYFSRKKRKRFKRK